MFVVITACGGRAEPVVAPSASPERPAAPIAAEPTARAKRPAPLVTADVICPCAPGACIADDVPGGVRLVRRETKERLEALRR